MPRAPEAHSNLKKSFFSTINDTRSNNVFLVAHFFSIYSFKSYVHYPSLILFWSASLCSWFARRPFLLLQSRYCSFWWRGDESYPEDGLHVYSSWEADIEGISLLLPWLFLVQLLFFLCWEQPIGLKMLSIREVWTLQSGHRLSFLLGWWNVFLRHDQIRQHRLRYSWWLIDVCAQEVS